MNNVLVNIQYPGGSHGAFLRYFIDRFSSHTPEITQSPFMSNGTSHNKDIKYSDRVRRWGFDDEHGTYDFKLQYADEPHLFVLIDEPAILHLARHNFFRPDDHEWTATYMEPDPANGRVEVNPKFVRHYKDNFKNIYRIDLEQDNILPFAVVRDFLKMMFLNPDHNQWLTTSKNSITKANDKTYFINLSEIWQTDLFMEKMKYIDKKLSLGLNLGQEAIDLHQQFLTKRFNHSTWNRANDMIHAIKNEIRVNCEELDLVEQAFINAWIEKNHKFVTTPFTREFFKDTFEIIEYITNFPDHYKAMNPNLQSFNGKPNPFYLWNKK